MEWDFACEDLESANQQQIPTMFLLLAYLEDDHSKAIDIRLRGWDWIFNPKFRGYQQFRRHERHSTALQLRAAKRRLVGIQDHGHKAEISEACTRRLVV